MGGRGVYYRKFTKSLIFQDFDYVLKILLDMCIFFFYL